MSMYWLERQLRESGDPVDAERANIIAAMLLSRGEDIPLPEDKEATDQQPDVPAKSPEEVAHSAGFLALSTQDSRILAKTHEEIGQEVENLDQLRGKLKGMLLPYEDLINYLLPQQTRGRFNIGGKKLVNSWTFDFVLRDLPVTSKVELQYVRGKTKNRAESLNVFLTNIDGVTEVRLPVTDGSINEVSIKASSEPQTSLGKLLRNTSLGRLLNEIQENKVGGTQSIRGVEASFNLLNPQFLMTNRFWMHNTEEGENYFYGTGEATLFGNFDPASNTFIVDKSDRLLWRNPSTESLTSLTVEEYIKLVEDALSIIPVVRTDY